MKKLRAVFIFLGVMFAVNAVAASIVSNMHLGIVLTYVLGVMFSAIGVFFEKIVSFIPKFIQYAFIVCVSVAAVCLIFIFVYGCIDTVTYDEDVVIVLGAGVRGEEVSASLKSRLDAALRYHEKNPDAIIVVSGGQGPDEDIAESLAMERYLTSKGVPGEMILQESASTSTMENFNFSKALLDDHFDAPYRTAFITNDYHIFRAELTAISAGFGDVSHYHAPARLCLIIPNGIRECIAVIMQWILL